MVTRQSPITESLRYKARDVINAPDIKEQILRRSQKRGDSKEIQTWLTSHFFKYVVGNFQAKQNDIVPIQTMPELNTLLEDNTAIPQWVISRLPSERALWWIIPDSSSLLKLEARILEFLQSRSGTTLEGKLQRINCPQALALWTLEHLEFEKKRKLNHYKHQPSAVTELLSLSTGRFVELKSQSPLLRQEMAFESQVMRHCLGQFASKELSGGYGETYASACEKSQMRLFSFRSHNHQPHITISAFIKDNGQLELEQIKGKQNRPPIARYQQDVLAFLNQLDFNEIMPDDIINMGIIRLPEALRTPNMPTWCLISSLRSEAEQLWLTRHAPHLFHLLPSPLPSVLWYVAGLNQTSTEMLNKSSSPLPIGLKASLKRSQSQPHAIHSPF